MSARLPVRHIGVTGPICGTVVQDHHSMREDLTIGEYEWWAKHRFKGEAPFRYCKMCLTAIDRRSIYLRGRR